MSTHSDVYAKKFTDLDEGEKKALAFTVNTLRAGDTIWHDSTSIWAWALQFITVVLDNESKTHPNVVMYVEYTKSNDKYGISIIRTEAPVMH